MSLNGSLPGVRTSPLRLSLGTLGILLAVVGLVMAAMPFVGALVGAPFDGSDVLALDRNRLALHVVPGIVGGLMGLALLHGHRRCVREGSSYPGWLSRVAVGAVAVGLWNGLGPWLLELVLPAGHETGLMFQNIPEFEQFSTAHRVAVEAFCHVVPGIAGLLASLAAYGIVQSTPARGRRAMQRPVGG